MIPRDLDEFVRGIDICHRHQVSEDTVILANGFSCREQVRQGAGRQVMHLAEFLQRAHRRAAGGR